MPEYLTPAVYVEETSFRSKNIQGVPTSTFGLTGLTRYGPVPHQLTDPRVTMVDKPTLVTSFTEFERAFGGLEGFPGEQDPTNYLAYAARGFFENGGRRLYVSRVFPFTRVAGGDDIDVDADFARLDLSGTPRVGAWRARWPGSAGSTIRVQVGFRRSRNVLVGTTLRSVQPGAAVEVFADPGALPKDEVLPDAANVRTVARTPAGDLVLRADDGSTAAPTAGTAVCHVTLDVQVVMGDIRLDAYTGLELGDEHPRAVSRVLSAERPTDPLALVWLDLSRPDAGGAATPAAPASEVLDALLELADLTYLTGGGDGTPLTPAALAGEKSDPDDANKAATGLAALGEIDDIAIVAVPDAVRLADEGSRKTAVDDLVAHCTTHRYRIGIVDPPKDASISGVRAFRSQFDTSYAALYYPWVEIVDPTASADPGAAPARLQLPPSGVAAGIYARTDITRGVHKAPANEVVLGITRFVQNVTFDRQSVLNPEGVNALRFFPGRSNRIWGARTMSSDPEWKYVNVRRLFIYLEHSIDKSTQWAVFEPNNEALWANIRQTVSDFLVTTWRTGALMGTKPEEAFFVRCDRTTMTQNDLDNGRLICLVGVAPTYPAEFVVFRIGQWTADAQQS